MDKWELLELIDKTILDYIIASKDWFLCPEVTYDEAKPTRIRITSRTFAGAKSLHIPVTVNMDPQTIPEQVIKILEAHRRDASQSIRHIGVMP